MCCFLLCSSQLFFLSRILINSLLCPTCHASSPWQIMLAHPDIQWHALFCPALFQLAQLFLVLGISAVPYIFLLFLNFTFTKILPLLGQPLLAFPKPSLLCLAWTHLTFSSVYYPALHSLFQSCTILSCSVLQCFLLSWFLGGDIFLSNRPWVKLWCLLFSSKMMAITWDTASILVLAENPWILGYICQILAKLPFLF